MKILRLEDAIVKQGHAICGWYWPSLNVKFLKSYARQTNMRSYFNRANQSIVFRLDGQGTPESYWPFVTKTLLDYGILCEPLVPSMDVSIALPPMEDSFAP